MYELYGIFEGLLMGTALCEVCYCEKNCNCNSYKFNYKLAFIPFLYFRLNQKQEPYFQEIGGLVQKIYVFCS